MVNRPTTPQREGAALKLPPLVLIAVLLALTTLLSWSVVGASSDGTTTFRVTITNTTAPQKELTFGAYLLHTAPGAFWEPGERANRGLEDIAEFAQTEAALTELGAVLLDRLPERGDRVTFEVRAQPGDLLSTAQMFSMTNDAFLGLNSLALFEDGVPVSTMLRLEAYDAGTEANTFEETSYEGEPTDEPITLLAEISGTQATVEIVPYPAIVLDSGATFLAWLGPEATVADVFTGVEEIVVVWRWADDVWERWSSALPTGQAVNFELNTGTVLFIFTSAPLSIPI